MTTALIDGDVMVYRVGFGAEGLPVKYAISRMRRAIDELAFMSADCDDYRLFLSPRGRQFRHDIAKRQDYKGNRTGSKKPEHYEALRTYLMENEVAQLAIYEEADDLLGINLTALGADGVCCSSDKDLLTVPGMHCRPVKGTKKWQLHYQTPQMAAVSFWRQMLTGDTVDNIPGVYGIGPALAARLVRENDTVEDMAAKVQMAYGLAGLTAEDLLEAGQLLFIRQQVGQVWRLP